QLIQRKRITKGWSERENASLILNVEDVEKVILGYISLREPSCDGQAHPSTEVPLLDGALQAVRYQTNHVGCCLVSRPDSTGELRIRPQRNSRSAHRPATI